MLKCNKKIEQKWVHTKNGFIKHLNSGLCIDMTNSLDHAKKIHYPRLEVCDNAKKEQIWQFRHYKDL